MTGSQWLQLGAVMGFVAVAMGAFGAHGLRERVLASSAPAALEGRSRYVAPERRLEVFETGARYNAYHAVALIAVGLLVLHSGPSTAANVAGWAFLLGMVIFSGSLYVLGLTGLGVLGAITPIGGVALLVGWAALAVAAAGLRSG
ncbi:MAG: DUF423 domain-containing protein [Isosphaeraceae bacterium]|jgi:uncharacterized membrane protein YgdD (TMEM256/DUF423 family)|nr:MAG: DUF423 domain-containing protein [Isosphaeraceae bacterium]